MPVARFQTPDGRIARFEVPEGTTPDQAQAMMEKEFPNLAVAESQPATSAERFLGHPLTRTALGLTSILTAPVQLGASIGEKLADLTGVTGKFGKTQFRPASQMPPGTVDMKAFGEVLGGVDAQAINKGIAELEAMKRRGMAARSGRPVGEEYDIAGGLGAIYPMAKVFTGITKVLPKVISEGAPSLTGRTIGRMVSGGGTAGLTIPETSGEDFFPGKGVQTAIGATVPVGMATLGSVIKGGSGIVKSVYDSLRDTIRNFTSRGQQRLAEEHIKSLAGEGGEPALKKTIASLVKPKTILSKPSAADAVAAANVGKPERFGGPVVRLQSELANLPETTTKLRSMEAAQEDIRKSALQSIAKGNTEESVLAERTTNAAKNYGKAFKDTVKADDTLESLMARPSMEKTLSRAKELASEGGKQFKSGDQYPVESLHFMKMAMDDLIKNPERFGIGASEAAAIGQTQKQFIKWMGDKSPAYDFARKDYERISKVLNRVQVRDTLEKILTGPKGEERTAMFLNATREIPRTFKKATGTNRYDKIGDILPPNETNIVQKLVNELERDAMVSRMTKEVNIPGATSPVTGKMSQLPSPLYRPTMVANWVLKRGGEEGNKNVNRIAAEILENPAKAAEVLGRLPSSTRQKVDDALRNFKEYAASPAAKAAAIETSVRLNE